MSPSTQRTSTAEEAVATEAATTLIFAHSTKAGEPLTGGARDESTTTTTATDDQDRQPPPQQKPAPRGAGAGRRWFHWHDPDTPPAEKRLLRKLDWFLLSFSCLTYFVKQLDQNNVTNAYVSGMREELGFGGGNELSWMNTAFGVGTILGGPVSNLILAGLVRPSRWLPGCLTAWSLFVLGSFRCETAVQLYVLRFLVGLAESAAWPGVMYCLGCWYRRGELARRSSLFVVSGVLGQMFSGFLQAALVAGMEGRGGLSAWRWLFVFDFVLAVPVAVYGFICFPDTPETTRAFYLTPWERARAVQRMEEKQPPPPPVVIAASREGGCRPRRSSTSLLTTRRWWSSLSGGVLPRVFGSWQVYAFTLAYAFWSLTAGSYATQFFALYLKSEGYATVDVNNIPTATGAVNLVFMLGTGLVADKMQMRGPVALAVGLLLTACYAVLTAAAEVPEAEAIPHALHMAAFVLMGCYGCYTPLLAGWANEACGGADRQKRAFVLAFMVSVGSTVVIPFQQRQFPSSGAPGYAATHGYASALAFVVALTLWTGVTIPLLERWQREKSNQGDVLEVQEEA